MADSQFDEALGASYRLQRRIGGGAAGDVWLAVDTRTNECVAAKLLRPEHVADRDLVARFVTERSLLVGLRHPSIVGVRDLVVEGERLAIVMDYIDGGSARELIQKSGPLTPGEAVRLVAAVLDGLEAAHEQGILHRDVKPDNVLLTSNWRSFASGSIKLTDFGIARLVTERARATNGMIGTPEYMSPELITTGECGPPADVYGAGILLYELLSGRTPFAGKGTDFTVAHRHVTTRPPELAVPPALWSELEALLDKDPARRPTAAEAARRLRRLNRTIDDSPALPPTLPPAEFEVVVPVTMVRGMPLPAASLTGRAVEQGPAPELGRSSQETMLRPMPRPSRPSRPRQESTPEVAQKSPWRDPRKLAIAIGALLLVAGAAVLFFRLSPGAAKGPAAAAGTIRATQSDRPTPAGLTIARTAEFDPQTQRVHLTITYSAQNAQLSGPFLEVLPGAAPGDDCPVVNWAGGAQRRNLPTGTGITTACAWSLAVGAVPAQGTQAVSADLALAAVTQNPSEKLQEWLDTAAATTAAATSDADLTSTAYPVQRLVGIQVTTADRVPSGKSLTITVLPVWPSGADTLNPLFKSPPVGSPSSMLVAIAGADRPVRFSDGCSGGLKVEADGIIVTTLTISSSCTVTAQVGNFTNLASNTFAIVTRGS